MEHPTKTWYISLTAYFKSLSFNRQLSVLCFDIHYCQAISGDVKSCK